MKALCWTQTDTQNTENRYHFGRWDSWGFQSSWLLFEFLVDLFCLLTVNVQICLRQLFCTTWNTRVHSAFSGFWYSPRQYPSVPRLTCVFLIPGRARSSIWNQEVQAYPTEARSQGASRRAPTGEIARNYRWECNISGERCDCGWVVIAESFRVSTNLTRIYHCKVRGGKRKGQWTGTRMGG